MAVTQQHIDPATPMGATLRGGGATFRVWAPRARAVYVLTDAVAASRQPGFRPRDDDRLSPFGDGTWTGFVAGVADGTPYRFWVIGDGGEGPKRDPYARELGTIPPFPDCDCLVRAGDAYPWHDAGWQPPAPADLIIHQFHLGTYFAVDSAGRDERGSRSGRALDLLFRIEYWQDLGFTAIQPLPLQEYPSHFSMGYNGTDYFSLENDYQVEGDAALGRYLAEANRLLALRHQPALDLADLRPGPHQLKVVVDLCHLFGIAVLADVVYNHAGGGFGDQSLYFFDRRPGPSNNESLYFTDQGWAGGLVFAFWNQWVRQFLIDNALFLADEYHLDGFRYDEVSVTDRYGGWSFAQDLAATVRYARPGVVQIAEYWNDQRWRAIVPPPDGLGYDAAWSDDLQHAIRGAVRQASFGASAPVAMGAIAAALPAPSLGQPGRAVQYLENHDLVYRDRPPERMEPRVPSLADGASSRSWYARSRSRVALGLLLTAPGIPLMFMGQEFLEDKHWSDNQSQFPGTLIWWEGLTSDSVMRDFHACARDLIRLRRRLTALRGDRVAAFHVNEADRVIAIHRWLEGAGADVVVVASLNDSTLWGYRVGFPAGGTWREVFNTDFYDGLPNPAVIGNGGEVTASGPGMHGFAQSAELVVPANAVTVFAR